MIYDLDGTLLFNDWDLLKNKIWGKASHCDDLVQYFPNFEPLNVSVLLERSHCSFHDSKRSRERLLFHRFQNLMTKHNL